jgi:hypothetical protein
LGAGHETHKIVHKIARIGSMETFEQAWERIADTKNGESVSEELRPLLQQVYERLVKQPPPDLQEIKDALENLLSYLTTPAGRTSANCVATDLFFCLEDWGVDWEYLPELLTDIIGDMGGALHDTISSPEIARNFDSLPEQLLERVRQWKPE